MDMDIVSILIIAEARKQLEVTFDLWQQTMLELGIYIKHGLCSINSLTPGRCGSDIKSIIFELIIHLGPNFNITLGRKP